MKQKTNIVWISKTGRQFNSKEEALLEDYSDVLRRHFFKGTSTMSYPNILDTLLHNREEFLREIDNVEKEEAA